MTIVASLAPLDLRLIRKLDELAGTLRTVSMCRTPSEVADLLNVVANQSVRLANAAQMQAELLDGGHDPDYEAQLHRHINAILGPPCVVELTDVLERAL